MRRLTVLLTCLLGLAAGTPAVAQDPSPPPWFGGRVELPELAMAITFPEDWLAFDLSADIDVQVEIAYDRVGDLFVLSASTTAAWLSGKAETYELLAFSPTSPVCELDVMPVPDSLLNPVAQEQVDAFIRAAEGISGYEGIAPVDVPAGPGVTMRWVQERGGPRGEDVHHASYTLDIGGRAVDVTCEGIVRPPDDWLSIVESIEVLSEAERSVPVGLGGRVEVPEFGYAVTFPSDWVWARHASLDPDALVAELANLTDASYAEEHRYMLSSTEGSSDLVGWPRSGLGNCAFGATPTERTLDDYVSDEVAYIEADDATYPDGVARTELTLGGDEAVRLDFAMTNPPLLPAAAGTVYLLVEDGRLHYIDCYADEAPSDRWLSIAETFHFLPAEE